MTALIFDCDGVLADTERYGHLPAFNQTFIDFGVPVQWTEETYGEALRIGGGKERMRSLLTPELVAAAGLPTDPDGQAAEIAKWHQHKTALYVEMVRAGRLPPRPGIARIVSEAQAAGWQLAVCSTSAEASVRAILENAVGRETASDFLVLAGDVVAAKKPAPDIYLLALDRLGIGPDEAIVVEDSRNGLLAAHAAGLATVVTVNGYTRGEDASEAALVVSSLGDPGLDPIEVLADRVGARPSGWVTLADLQACLGRPEGKVSLEEEDQVTDIDAKSEKMHDLVEADAEVQQLGTGFTFTEGPIWHPLEQRLYFSDMPADVRRSITLDGDVSEVLRPSRKCNGMTLDAQLDLIVCEHVTSSLVRERADGVRETLAYHWQGQYLNSPNDVCLRSDGTIYFTDPFYGRNPFYGVERERDLGWQGVFRIPPGGGQAELDLVVAEDEFDMPNGLCFSPDESRLYVNDTPRGHIKVFEVLPDGRLTNGRLYFEGIISETDAGKPDGMKCDELGNIWVTGPRGVWVISPEAQLLGVVPVPEVIGNLAWGGPDWRTLFIAASTSVYTLRTSVRPRREPFMPEFDRA